MKKYLLLLLLLPLFAFAATNVSWTKNGTYEYPNYINDTIGIGLTTPSFANLEVKGTTTTANGRVLALWDSSNNGLVTVQNNGNVGIGTTSPGSPLSIGNTGGISIYPTATSTFGSSANGLNLTNGCYAISGTCIGTPLANTLANGFTATTTFSNGGVVFSDGTKLTQDTPQFFWDDTNNRVGIGTSTPPSKFTVSPSGSLANGQPLVLLGTSTVASPLAGGTVIGYNSPIGFVGNFFHMQNNGVDVLRIGGYDTGQICIGYNCNTNNQNYSTAIGQLANSNFNSVAIGFASRANSASTAVGVGATAQPSNATVLGTNSNINSNSAGSTLVGYNSLIGFSGNSTSAVGIGTGLDLSGTESIAIGTGIVLKTNYTGVLGTSVTKWGVGTSTPVLGQFTIATSTTPQVVLSASAGLPGVAIRNDGTNYSISSTTVAGTATTSITAFEVALGGFGTTTVRGLNIAAQATTTSNVGVNLSGGCYAIGGVCPTVSSSGINTPTATNVTNITASTPNNSTYTRVGNIVNVAGSITVTNTLAVASEVDVSLPVASNFAAATSLNGTATMDSTASVNMYIKGDATNDRASIFFTSAGVGQTSTIYYTFGYQVI